MPFKNMASRRFVFTFASQSLLHDFRKNTLGEQKNDYLCEGLLTGLRELPHS
jgi:hypothetical protein